jgi:hypothetical protein
MIISLFALAALGTPVLLFFVLMPALLELRKPKDAGPRLIMLDILQALPAHTVKVNLLDLEEHNELDITLKHLSTLFSATFQF